MNISFVKSVVSMSLLFLALTGCSGKETMADLMRDDASTEQTQVNLKNQIAKDWETGQKMMATGEKRVEDATKQMKSAERNLKNGQDKIARGQREISEGQKLVTDSEQIFRANYPEANLNQTN